MVNKPTANYPSAENTLLFSGAKFSFLIDGENTGGQYAVMLIEKIKGLEPPPHLHTNEDEYFFLLEGEVTYVVSDEVIHASPGTYIHIPRGVQHAFSVKTDKAKVLAFICPAGLEKFFKKMSVPVPENYTGAIQSPSPDEMQHMLSVAEEYGIKFHM
ncbi:cupin domain-containing protein [Planococcus sp. SE5232]|uniref:cupin domain-containing protein n=1 Tax=unclassified Planococcus (in: firmicutes) TaxID=2662419 RepID=UPI003D6BD7FE